MLADAHRLPVETVSVEEALDRVLAAEVVAEGDLPPFANSAMDGYAIASGTAGEVLRVVGESRAGAPASSPVRDGEAIRISTGAAIPDGAVAVIRQEDVRSRDDGEPDRAAGRTSEAGANIRLAGEDAGAGTPLLAPGDRVGPAALGMAVAAGAAELLVSAPGPGVGAVHRR